MCECMCVCVCFILPTIKVVFWRFSSVPFAVRACTIDRHGRHLKAVLTAFFQPCERKVCGGRKRKRIRRLACRIVISKHHHSRRQGKQGLAVSSRWITVHFHHRLRYKTAIIPAGRKLCLNAPECQELA